VIGGNHNGEEAAGTRRIRKTRFLQSRQSKTIESRPDDLPVFLINPDRPFWLEEPQPIPDADRRNRVSLLFDQFTALFSKRYLAFEEWLNSFSRPAQDLGFRWQRSAANEHIARIALIVLLIPLLFLLTPGETPHFDQQGPVDKKAPAKVATPIAVPEFNLEERLGFAQAMRDRLVFSAIKSDYDRSKPPEAEARNLGPSPTEANKPLAAEEPSEVDVSSVPAVIIDDRQWSLPFDSQKYKAAGLPQTPADSFRAEISISPLLNEAASVAEAVVPADERESPAKPKSEKRKKVVAQRKRPAPAKQLTASAGPAPAVTQQLQPNLPPPPILFFLGAPPPVPPSQPAAAPQQPQPSTAPASKPSSPPQNNSWLPASIYDSVKNAY
jgi:hypothetical protein